MIDARGRERSRTACLLSIVRVRWRLAPSHSSSRASAPPSVPLGCAPRPPRGASAPPRRASRGARAGPAPRATRGASLVRVAPRRRPRARLDASAPRDDDAPSSSAPHDDASSSSSSAAQLARILRAVSDAGTPFLPRRRPRPSSSPSTPTSHELEPGLAADGGALHACRGRDAYAALAARARVPGSCDRELVRCRLAVTRAAATGRPRRRSGVGGALRPQKLEWMLVAAERWPAVLGGRGAWSSTTSWIASEN